MSDYEAKIPGEPSPEPVHEPNDPEHPDLPIREPEPEDPADIKTSIGIARSILQLCYRA